MLLLKQLVVATGIIKGACSHVTLKAFMFCFQNSSYLVTYLNQRHSQILEKLEKAKRRNGSLFYVPIASYPSAKTKGFLKEFHLHTLRSYLSSARVLVQ